MLLTMSSEPFSLYQTTWLVYLATGSLFMLMLWYKVRRWGFWSKTILLSFFAAGTYSFNGVPDAETYAPSAISFILELENEGIEGELTILTYLVISWLIFIMLTVAARHLLKALGNSNDDPVSNVAAKLAKAKQQPKAAAQAEHDKSGRTEPSFNE